MGKGGGQLLEILPVIDIIMPMELCANSWNTLHDQHPFCHKVQLNTVRISYPWWYIQPHTLQLLYFCVWWFVLPVCTCMCICAYSGFRVVCTPVGLRLFVVVRLNDQYQLSFSKLVYCKWLECVQKEEDTGLAEEENIFIARKTTK